MKNTIELILDLEAKLNKEGAFNSEKLLQIWPLFRVKLFMETQVSGENDIIFQIKNGKISFRIIKIAMAIVKELVIDWNNNASLKKCDIFFSTSSANRLVRQQGKALNAFVSPLYHWFNEQKKNVRISIEEYPGLGEFRFPRDIPTKYCGIRSMFVFVISRIFKIPIDEDAKSFFEKVKGYVDELGGNSSPVEIRNVQRTYSYFVWATRYYTHLFKRIRPKIVCVPYYYSTLGMAMLCAANRSDIKTVDIQHGVQGKYHVAYGQWPTPPYYGYELLPKIFWCWDNADVENIRSWADGKHIAIEGGNVWNQYVAVQGSRFPFPQELEEKIRKSDRSIIILVTLQPFLLNLEFYDLFQSIVDASVEKEANNIFWLIRMHPLMFSEEAKLLERVGHVKDRIEISLSSRAPLLRMLDRSHLHVTISSSVVLEAEKQGVRSLSVSKKLTYYESQQRAGTLLLINNGETLLTGIKRALKLPLEKKENIQSPDQAIKAVKYLLQQAMLINAQ